MKKEVSTKKAPAAVGPYSQAVQVGNMIFCAGNIGINPKTNKMVDGGVKEQTRQVLENLRQILKSAGLDINDVVKTTVYIQNMSDFTDMNEVYGSFFKKPYPARATVEVAKLPKEALVEIECIAVINVYEECCNCEGGCGCDSKND